MTDRSHSLLDALHELRRQVEPHFRPDTAAQGFKGTAPSTGHCAVVSVLVHNRLGGEFVSAFVDDVSHWFNRLRTKDGALDVDLTADQFGRQPIEMAVAGQLYDGARIRSSDDLNVDTLQRAMLLARRAGMSDVVAQLEGALAKKALVSTR